MYKLFTLAALASVVVAAPGHGGQGGAKQCNTGSIQCCNTVDNASNEDVAKELGLVGLVIQDLNIPIGIQCNPIDIIGIGGNSCTQQPVCCEKNNFNGAVAIGCTPINLNL